jgi:hypothetical protein
MATVFRRASAVGAATIKATTTAHAAMDIPRRIGRENVPKPG